MSKKSDSSAAPAPLSLDKLTIVEALDDTTGLIPAAVAPIGINARLTTGQATRTSDWMTIEIRRRDVLPPTWTTLVGAFQLVDYGPQVPDIINKFIPAIPPQFPHGLYELRNSQFRNRGGAPGEVVDSSDPAPFRVDTIAPYAVETSREQPAVPVFANAPRDTVINDDFLNREGGVEITIPPNNYPALPGRFELGDNFYVYLGPAMDPRPEYLVSDPEGIPMQDTGGSLFVPKEAILNNGLNYLIYTIKDLAGNISRPSISDFRTVALFEDPDPLALFLPLAPAPRNNSIDDLLDINDYRQGITAEVETYTNHVIGLDKFELQVETQPFGTQTEELTEFPVVFKNFNDAIKAAYTNQLGPQRIVMRYRVDRNGVFFLSPDKAVMLDLSLEGPTLPGTLEPGDVNPALELAQVYGAVSNRLNTLTIDDADQPVRIVIPLWTIAAVPHPDNRFFLFWGAAKEKLGPFPLSTLTPGADATFNIPWEVVARNGNGNQNISYSVIGPGTTNENPSGVTQVNVEDAVRVVLPAAEFLHLSIDREWTCESLQRRSDGLPPARAAELFIPADPRLVVGNIVTVTVTVTCAAFGFPPGPFTDFFESAALTQKDVEEGFIVDIPYGNFLKQCVFGPCVVTYTTTVNTGGTGHGAEAGVYTEFSSPGSYCDGTEIVRPPVRR